MKSFFSHLLFPRSSNNYRPKILHHSSLFILILFFLISSFLLSFIKTTYPSVLGISANISNVDLLQYTNQKRQEAGLASLELNDQLSQAAAGKARDMFTEDYWAHNSPDGKTPWIFIKNAGYSYIYAGENLARGYSNAQDVINAWMASPEHKKNMLSSSYRNVGFAVEAGKLGGEDTILVVEMLGSSAPQEVAVAAPVQAVVSNQPVAIEQEVVITPAQVVSNSQPVAIEQKVTITPVPTVVEDKKNVAGSSAGTNSVIVAGVNSNPLLESNGLSKNFAIAAVSLLLTILILDIIIIEKRKIVRFVGHNLDHVFFLTLILIIVIILSKGAII